MTSMPVLTARRLPSSARRRPALRPLVLAMACLGLTPALAQTLPTGFRQIAGGVSAAQPNAATLNVHQSTGRAIAQWDSFSIGAGGTVNIAQPGTGSVLLNRVVGNELSTIAGTLKANGQVFLVNPNGVMFGRSASVNVGGLIASSLDIGNAAFMEGGPLVFSRADGNKAAVINAGQIRASDGATVALLGETVRNEGDIHVARGSIGLVSGRQVSIDFAGDGLTTFRVASETAAARALVDNAAGATLAADGGRVVMLAQGGADAKAWVVNQQGTVRAQTLAQRNGEIILGGGAGDVRVAGTLDVTGAQPGSRGGRIDIDGGRVLLDAQAALDASGTAGGGSVRVHARDLVATADGASVRSDATAAGDGGRIVLFGENGLRARGALSARGGPLGGNGGFIETSGKALDVGAARIDARAPAGVAGEWFIDPYDIEIRHGEYDPGAPPCTGFGCTDVLFAPFTAGASSHVYDGSINTALATTSKVTINTGLTGPANGTISFGEGVVISYTGAGARTFRLEANSSITAPASTQIGSTGGPLNVEFVADFGGTSSFGGSIDFGGTINTNGGHVEMSASSVFGSGIRLTGGNINTAGGAVRLNGQGSTSQSDGPPEFPGGATIDHYGVVLDGFDIASGSGAVQIVGRGVSPTELGGPFNFGVGGVALLNASTVTSTSGNIDISGSVASTVNPLPGLDIAAGSQVAAQQGNVTLRAQAPATIDAFNLGGTVKSTSGAINVRRTAADGFITLGGPAVAGFNVSQAELGRLLAPDVSFGASEGSFLGGFGIRVAGPISAPGFQPSLTLETGFGGAIELNGSIDVGTGTLALVGGLGANITQGAGASINANSLVVNAPSFLGGGGNVTLTNAANSVNDFAASAGGNLAFTNGGNLTVSSLGYVRADGTAAQQVGVSAASVRLQTPGSLLSVEEAVTATSSVVLQGQGVLLSSTVTAGNVSILAANGVDQNAGGGGVVASSLLVQAADGDVAMTSTGNRVGTLAGSASGRFDFLNATALAVGTAASTDPSQTVSASGVAADSVRLRTLGGDLVVGATLAVAQNAVLQSDAGNVALGAGVQAADLALLAAGDVTQSAAGGIAAGNLLARASNGDVRLGTAENRAVTLAGGAGGRFDYTDADALRIGAVSVLAAPALERPETLAVFVSGTGIDAGSVRVRTVTGDLGVDAAVAADTTASLEAGAAGNVVLNATVGAQNMALAGSGLAQSAAGTIVTGGLLATARTGDVALTDAANRADTVAGRAAGRFAYVDADGVTVGSVAVADAAAPQSGSGVAAASTAWLGTTQGDLRVTGPVDAPSVVLDAAGSVLQGAAATGSIPVSVADAGSAIGAGTLLARARAGDVLLANAANRVATVAGTATGRFDYADADALAVGSVAAADIRQSLSAVGVVGNTVRVRTFADDLTLAAPVTSTAGADLVAAERLQNPGGHGVTGTTWRVWARTWEGETRGGLAGSGALPNLYNCAYAGLCGVGVPAGDNHFIYAAQPRLTLVAGSGSYLAGTPPPALRYTATGYVLGDTAATAGLSGSLGTTATASSPPGRYPVDGQFVSAAGYAVDVVPGTLTANALVFPLPDAVRELPTTWLYDRNIGAAPMCFATGPLQGDGARQGGDVLAREWSRVRSRPNLTNCVDTERRNGCADF